MKNNIGETISSHPMSNTKGNVIVQIYLIQIYPSVMLLLNFTTAHIDTSIVATAISLLAQVNELENHVCMQSFSRFKKTFVQNISSVHRRVHISTACLATMQRLFS